MIEPTTEQYYISTMHSVNLIQQGKPETMDVTEWQDCVKRNKEHIQLMMLKDFWTNEDLTSFQDAVDTADAMYVVE